MITQKKFLNIAFSFSVSLVALLVFLFIFNNIRTFSYLIYDNEESEKTLPALIIYQDIKAIDLNSFFKHTFNQSVYPFLNSWLLGLYYLVFGVSVISSRSYSLTCYFFFLIVLYLLGRKIYKGSRNSVSLIPCFFALTSSTILIYSAKSTLELPFLLIAYCTFFIYLSTIDKPSNSKFIAVSCLMSASFFIEYGYGILIVITLLITHLINNGLKIQTIINKQTRYLFLPFITLSTIWLIFPFYFIDYTTKIAFTSSSYLRIKLPYKLAGFLFLPTTDTPYCAMFSWENICYYFKIINNEFSISIFIALLFYICFFASFRRIRDKRINFLLIYFLVTMTLSFFYLIKDSRYIISAIPCLWLLTGYQIDSLILKAKKGLLLHCLLQGSIALFAFFHAPAIINLYKNYPQRLSSEYESKKAHWQVYDFIISAVDLNKKIVEVGFRDPLFIQGFIWHILAKPSNKDIRYDDLSITFVPLWNLADDLLYDARSLIRLLREHLKERDVDYIILSECPNEPYDGYVGLRYRKTLAACRKLLESQNYYKMTAKKLFNEIETKVTIYALNNF